MSGAKDALRCDAVTLYRYDEDSGELGYPPTVIGVKYPKKVYRFPKVPEESIVWKTLHSKIPIIIDDTSTDLFTKDRRFTIEEGIKSLVAIPLHAGNRKVGAMFINYRNQHRFVEDELINIRLFANQAAVAIRNTQMHLEIQQRLETLESLHEAGRVITSSFTLNETLDRIAEQAFNIVKASIVRRVASVTLHC